MRDINQRRLRYFHAVYTHGKIRTAADYLNTDSSVITRQIGLLEQEIGFKLFERRPRGVAPTEVAKSLLEYYCKNREARAEFEADVRALNEMRRGSIHIATASTFVAPLMDVFNQFHRQCPNVSLNIEEIFEPNKIIRQILDDILHIGIIHLCPERPDIQLYASVPLPLYMLVSKEHPLAQKQKVTLKEAMSSSLSLPASGVSRELVQSACRTEKIALPPCIFESDSTVARKKFAYDGLGAVFMSIFSAREEIKKGKLIALEIDHPFFQSAKLSLVVRRGKPLLPATHQLLKSLHRGLSIFTHKAEVSDHSLIRSGEEN
ncbi:Transcriptional regulator, LysR family [Mycoavidus cysteinexigens]|uniref:Transcriptional regulator, LysR family n=1 Tax=Mycoavidus cysteinexigens TaxID=1553431 RepID=A0A2Z6EXX5_9BURK|nr:LysR family transcriptional regulator [Mycoavidus cysteinexigens]BBE09965.1 Transcriptional regulator, LysR family [Mycoavidus cysteinexigens]GAM53687.1 probable transcriptional activator, LysR family [bacterium endosymbiont of Mortierella elongata FMR23-6]GLR00405.1 LysR family transcriptional regulator [Mycoavidus cysteinexigens]